MNYTALKTAFTSLTFSARIYRAMVNVAKYKHSVAHVPNRKGHPVLAVRYSRINGFSFLDSKGRDCTVNVLALLKIA